MKNFFLLVALAFSSLALIPKSATAQEVKPINLALFPPIQIVPEDQSVGVFRFSLIYGRNVDVKYVDIGLVMKTDGLNEGVQWGVAGLGHDFTGVQWNWLGSYNTGTLKGGQVGFVNWSAGPQSKWVQWGAVNVANDFEGLQFGFVNYTKDLEGVQLGLINIATNGGLFGLPVFPFINFKF